MNQLTRDRLYKLLPAIYQLRDVAEGEPLRALLAAIEQELLTIETDISDLYDNWFIETCAEWVVPYIGDLLDVRKLYADNSHTYGQQERRAYIANTLAYRRRKGTTSVLEQLARDITGWRARAVEFARLVAVAQNLNHLRSASTTFNLRANNTLQQVGTPFEQQAAYTVEVRRVNSGGRYNVPNIGLFIWRLQSYHIQQSTARAVAGLDTQPSGRYYTFNPLGYDAPLFNQPQTETNIVTLTQEINVPAILRRPALAEELLQRRQLLLQGEHFEGIGYFDRDPVLQIFINGKPNPIPPEEILICSLEDANKNWRLPNPDDERSADDPIVPTKVVAVDPELGRIAFFNTLPQRVEVSYLFGFSDDLGAGSYPRNQTKRDIPTSLIWEIEQATSADPNPLATAIQTWNRTTEAWQKLRDNTHISLANITIPLIQVSQIEPEKVRHQFNPGIIGNGLRVIATPDRTRVIVTAGRAVDAQGRLITLREDVQINLQNFDVDNYPHRTGLLVIFYRSNRQVQVDLEIEFIPEAAIDTYAKGTFISLAQLTLNAENQLMGIPDPSIRNSFQPGIVQGLEVKVKLGKLEAIITAGMAVDREGRTIAIANNTSLDLTPEQGETKLLSLSINTGLKGGWQFELLPPEQQINHNQISLAKLDIPQVKIKEIIPQGNRNNSENSRISALTIKGLNVTSVNLNQAIIDISAGTITDSKGREVYTLDRDYQFDLSAYSGQNITIFISHQTKQGLPLKLISSYQEGWRNIGIVPQEPAQSEIGVIVIRDNRTYRGNLSIKIPIAKQLQIIAADGYNPHLQGNIFVRGTANADNTEPGELILDGLLVEGRVTVQAGNLKSLQINHCTLVPQQGGLRVEPSRILIPEPEADNNITLIAYIMYCLTWLWQLIRQDLRVTNSSSRFHLLQLFQPGLQQLKLFTAKNWQTLNWWKYLQDLDNDADLCLQSKFATRNDNSRLEITLYRTICGSIYLADTVPKLQIEDSIIDKGKQHKTSEIAISALGTDVEIKTTTILGITTARSLEASNSIFTERVIVMRHQSGCIRFSHVPETSQTPRRYQCQPDITFKNELDILPEAITCLDVRDLRFNNVTIKLWILLLDIDYLASILFLRESLNNQLRVIGTAGNGIFRYFNNNEWKEINRNLSNRHITAILIYSPHSVDNHENTTVILAGTTDGSLFSYSNQGEDWKQLNISSSTQVNISSNTPITALLAYTRPATGTVSSNEDTLIGYGTLFSSELRENDTITVGDETRFVTAIGQEGTGTISSIGIIVTGQGVELRKGDTITAYSQTRVVTEISASNNLETVVQINAPFSSDLPAGTSFKINIDTVLKINAAFSSTLPLKTSLKINQLLVATAGEGVLRANDSCENWEAINTGLNNVSITTLAFDSTGQLFAGTSGSGVFHLLSRDSQNPTIRNSWLPFNIGLTNGYVTALAINNQDQIFAGTADGGVFHYNREANGWIAVNQGLTNFNIKTLTVVENSILAGTADGKIFRSDDGGKNWHSPSLDLQGIEITVLKADNSNNYLFAGTAAGDILRSTDTGNSWLSINQGLRNVDKKLLIMERLQPSFTSTQYGNPSYAQLNQNCALEIRTGAEDGAEMGAFNFLKQPQREANLQASLEEYLRFGLEASIFYVT
jgi:Phage tail protein (Tail_P2_I)